MKNIKAQLPVETIIFVVLNVIYFASLFYFVVSASSGALVMDKFYAKQIALLIDDSKPGTILTLNIDKAYEIAKDNEINLENAFFVEGNYFVVKLSSSRGYKFQFFNDVDIERSFVIEENNVDLILEVK
jgi:hypothetical protein